MRTCLWTLKDWTEKATKSFGRVSSTWCWPPRWPSTLSTSPNLSTSSPSRSCAKTRTSTRYNVVRHGQLFVEKCWKERSQMPHQACQVPTCRVWRKKEMCLTIRSSYTIWWCHLLFLLIFYYFLVFFFYLVSVNRDSATRNRLRQSQHSGEHHPSQAYANQMRRRFQSDTTSQHVHRVGAPYSRGIL